MALTTWLPFKRADPFYGFVETTGDALRLIQAARQGIVPRITRRLNDLERRAMIRSGAVFIFSDEESGIKRWTEGLSWSASRIVGNFLVYREVTDRSDVRNPSDVRLAMKQRANPVTLSSAQRAESKLVKSLFGCLSDTSGRFKRNGLVKKTITINVKGSDHHLVAYYSQEDVRLGKLPALSSRSDIMSVEIPSELLETTRFRIPPTIYNGEDGRPQYICDVDNGDLNIPCYPACLELASQQTVSCHMPQAGNGQIFAGLVADTLGVCTTTSHSLPPCTSPSPISSASPGSFETSFWWPKITTPQAVSSFSQDFYCAGANQSSGEVHNYASIDTSGPGTDTRITIFPHAPQSNIIDLYAASDLGEFEPSSKFQRPGLSSELYTLCQ